jgi:hypothetical protein
MRCRFQNQQDVSIAELFSAPISGALNRRAPNWCGEHYEAQQEEEEIVGPSWQGLE